MTNPYYNASGWPAASAPGASSSARAELSSIAAGFDKLPTLTSNTLKLVRVNAGETALEATNVLPTLGGDLLFTDATYDIGKSGATRPRDGFFSRNVVVGGTFAVTGVATLTAQPVLSSLTASQAVFTDASKGLVSNAITGSGNVVMSASPTLSGTVGGALTWSGAQTYSAAMTYGGVTLSNSVTGTGSMMLSASPTTTGTLTGAAASFSGAVTAAGVITRNAPATSNSVALAAAGTTTGAHYALFSNTSGNIAVGVEGATPFLITGATAYDGAVTGKSGISFSANDGAALHMRLSSSGLSVTGTLGVSGTTTFGNSGGGTFFTTTSAGTNQLGFSMVSTGGTNLIAMDNSAGSAYGDAGNYGTLWRRPASTAFDISRAGTSDFHISASGAVTIPGTLGVTGAVSVANEINSTGSLATNSANKITLSYEGSNLSRINTFGVDTGTKGYLELRCITSNASAASTYSFSATACTMPGTLGVTGEINSTAGINQAATGGFVALASIAPAGTTGHFYVTCGAGAPSGVPNKGSGAGGYGIAMYYDTTNDYLYVYRGGWKKSAVYA